MTLPAGSPLVLVDTVGFVGDLPHELVAAFRATLEETRQADLLLHVIDAGGPDGRERAGRVNEVLAGIDAGDLPQIEVLHKVDRRVGPAPGTERDDTGAVRRVWLSARTGEGIEALAAALGERFEAPGPSRELRLPPGSGRMRARLYALGAVLGERPCDDGGSIMEVRIAEEDLARLWAAAGRSRPPPMERRQRMKPAPGPAAPESGSTSGRAS